MSAKYSFVDLLPIFIFPINTPVNVLRTVILCGILGILDLDFPVTTKLIKPAIKVS